MNQVQSDALRAAERYESFMVPAFLEPWAGDLLALARPAPGERVLDVACGTGVIARHVAPLVGATGAVAALDLNPAMLAVARSLPAPAGAPVAWHQGNALELPFPDDSFDLVLCQQGLQFMPDRRRALAEMRRVLAPGGRVALSVWQAVERNPLSQAIGDAVGRRIEATGFNIAFSLGDERELRDLMEGAGFGPVEILARERTVRLPAPDRVVELLIQGATAAVPALAQMDAAARQTLIATARAEVAGWIGAHTRGDTLEAPTAALIGLGWR
jgi:ubiquinone/menaquinone biosynthesis C-methylase UbiE